jgi:hypothetical protein
MFTKLKPKTPKLHTKKKLKAKLPKVERIKLKTPKLPKVNKNLKKIKWRTLKVYKSKTKKPLNSQKQK